MTPRPSGAAIGFEDLEPVLLIVGTGAEPPVRRKRPNAGEVLVELGREEAGAAHLAVAHHVDAGVLLVAQRHIDGVVEHLREVHRSEFAALARRPGPTTSQDGRACDPTTLVRSASVIGRFLHRCVANAKARAGLRTNRRLDRRRRARARPSMW